MAGEEAHVYRYKSKRTTHSFTIYKQRVRMEGGHRISKHVIHGEQKRAVTWSNNYIQTTNCGDFILQAPQPTSRAFQPRKENRTLNQHELEITEHWPKITQFLWTDVGTTGRAWFKNRKFRESKNDSIYSRFSHHAAQKLSQNK